MSKKWRESAGHNFLNLKDIFPNSWFLVDHQSKSTKFTVMSLREKYSSMRSLYQQMFSLF